MRRAALVLLVLGAAAAAAAVSVQERSYSGLAAEVVTVGSSFAVLPGGVAVSTLGLSPAGATQGTAVEIAPLLPTASPGVAAGRYAYTATLREAGAASVSSGTYRAELRYDGVSLGSVFFRQGVSDLLDVEGVTVVWDLGTTSAPAGARAYDLVVTAV